MHTRRALCVRYTAENQTERDGVARKRRGKLAGGQERMPKLTRNEQVEKKIEKVAGG